MGQFISPDTLVPDAGLVMDYNRFMYARGNPMRLLLLISRTVTGHL